MSKGIGIRVEGRQVFIDFMELKQSVMLHPIEAKRLGNDLVDAAKVAEKQPVILKEVGPH